MIRLTIDGREIEAEPGQTILEVARQRGIHIPTLCHHEALVPFGACRLCVVEIEGGRGKQLVASCAYPCTDGLVVHSYSDVVLQSRRMTVELLMSSSAHVPIIRRLAAELGISEPRFTLERNDCVLCGLCVRACREIVGVGAISVINRGIEKKVSPPFQIASNACIECGTCVLICPTGAITFEDITGGASTVHAIDDFDATDCHICGEYPLAPQFASDVMLLGEASEAVQPAIQEMVA